MCINPKLISKDKNKEGVYHKSDKGAIYMFFNQLGGEKLRLDIYDGKKISDVEEFKNYNIISCSDKYNPKSKVTTYYLSPKKEYYTDTTGVTYRTTSVNVFIDEYGDYRTFSDYTKKHLDSYTKWLDREKERLKKALKLKNETDIERCQERIKNYEKIIAKYKKDLSRGM
ncbi:Uncharacterised protein [uncultured Clostridium sp.]|nr:Uncharacterised protein [uncultured Clostridium sp.]SCJ53600.1 Uncharacterised protein [uncultured Clostridium sp.]